MKHSRQDYMHIQDPKGLIPEDEPVFLLRGQDLAAPFAVRSWAQKVGLLGGDKRLIIAALDFANEMEKWPKKKMPDLPEKPEDVKPPPEKPADVPTLPPADEE